MFRSPEHAIAVAYLMLALPIEPKNPTQLVIEMLRKRFDDTYRERPLTGLTPHEWHAQAVMTVSFTKRQLRDDPILIGVLQAEYASGLEFAAGVRAVTDWLKPSASGSEQLAIDMLVVRMFRRRPTLRDIEANFGVPKSTLGRWDDEWRARVFDLKHRAVCRLDGPMTDVGLVTHAVEAA